VQRLDVVGVTDVGVIVTDTSGGSECQCGTHDTDNDDTQYAQRSLRSACVSPVIVASGSCTVGERALLVIVGAHASVRFTGWMRAHVADAVYRKPKTGGDLLSFDDPVPAGACAHQCARVRKVTVRA
jgi:hypothetical protein